MEPFKNVFHPAVITLMADHILKHHPTFPHKKFLTLALTNLQNLELKQRSAQIQNALTHTLTLPFPQACTILEKTLHPSTEGAPTRAETDLHGIQGWLIMPIADYIAQHGKKHIPRAMLALQQCTMRFTAEFAIRHLLLTDLTQVLQILTTWLNHPNEHVRRLITEGTRPRLPWGLKIPAIAAAPATTIPILTKLRDDPSEYVRRSVANHLNDFTKDHPTLIAQLATDWKKNAPPERQKLLRHALRNMLKSSHPSALKLHGYHPAKITKPTITLHTPKVKINSPLLFTINFQSLSNKNQKIRLDYTIHYRTAQQKNSPKTYLWKETNLPAGAQHHAEKKHPFRIITTRTYHPGEHHLEITLNGTSLTKIPFLLLP